MSLRYTNTQFPWAAYSIHLCTLTSKGTITSNLLHLLFRFPDAVGKRHGLCFAVQLWPKRAILYIRAHYSRGTHSQNKSTNTTIATYTIDAQRTVMQSVSESDHSGTETKWNTEKEKESAANRWTTQQRQR